MQRKVPSTGITSGKVEVTKAIWEAYLVLFKSTLLLHVRAVLPSHNSFYICHWHCIKEERKAKGRKLVRTKVCKSYRL